MMDFLPVGQTGRQPIHPNQKKMDAGSAAFQSLMAALREQDAPAGDRTSGDTCGEGLREECLAARRRLGYENLTEDAIRARVAGKYSSGTVADRCRAALELCEVGIDEEAMRSEFRQAFGKLLEQTETECGHLAHDDLARIMAMYSHAQDTMREQ